jgi:hypothetical protein
LNRREWKQRKDALQRKKYAAGVMAAYDHMEHVIKREQLELKSEAERVARNHDFKKDQP